MAEYIEREALLSHQYNKSWSRDPQFAEMVVDVENIYDAPAADVVEVRHGRWIVFNDGTEESPKRDHMRCSVCGWYWSIPEHRTVFSYCPNCGAKMDGGNRNGTD